MSAVLDLEAGVVQQIPLSTLNHGPALRTVAEWVEGPGGHGVAGRNDDWFRSSHQHALLHRSLLRVLLGIVVAVHTDQPHQATAMAWVALFFCRVVEHECG